MKLLNFIALIIIAYFPVFADDALCLTADCPLNDQNPAFSTSGYELLFSSGRAGGDFDLWIMDMFDYSVYPLTDADGDEVNLPGSSWNAGRIVFSGEIEAENDDIYMISPDASELKRITVSDSADWEPSSSPDAARITFQSNRGGNWEIFLIDSTGTNLKRLTTNMYDDWEPNFSPAGSLIVFQSNRSGNWDIFIIDTTIMEAVNLTDEPSEDTDPSFSPDGEWIVYSSDKYGDDGDICAISIHGGEPIRLTDNPAYDGAPSISPDGTTLAFESDRSGNLDLWILNGIDSVMSVFDNAKQVEAKICISPNPFNSYCHISHSGKIKSASTRIAILDILGNRIASFKSIPALWQPAKDLPSGIYIVKNIAEKHSLQKTAIYIK